MNWLPQFQMGNQVVGWNTNHNVCLSDLYKCSRYMSKHVDYSCLYRKVGLSLFNNRKTMLFICIFLCFYHSYICSFWAFVCMFTPLRNITAILFPNSSLMTLCGWVDVSGGLSHIQTLSTDLFDSLLMSFTCHMIAQSLTLTAKAGERAR